jgi:LPPG:FO 2-phospho-L-lactate transferase
MRIVVITGGVGGARFLRGLKSLRSRADGRFDDLHITAIVNTADDITLHGLRVCPDLDTVMYTLGEGIDESRGWGRAGETFHAQSELTAYGAGPEWFGLGDRDLATHLIRTRMLDAGYSLTDVTAALCARWDIGIELLPMSDDRVETHVVVDVEGERTALHFQEWWLRHRAALPAHEFLSVGAPDAKPAPGVIEAVLAADAVIIAPSNPVVSVAPVLAVPGIRDAIITRPTVGISPIIGGAPVRGHADACLASIGVAAQAGAVALHYGARSDNGLLDAWLVDTVDADAVEALSAHGIASRSVPLLMSDVSAAADMAEQALALLAVTA